MPKLCLNMIVKNEEHIIEELLTSIREYIDYYVIVDTGSTDKTKNIIRDFAVKNNLEGEIHDRVWRDFGTNRSEALDLCEGKADYVLILDADNFLRGTIDVSNLTHDAYTVHYRSSISLNRTQLIKNDGKIKWCWRDVLHEFLAPVDLSAKISHAQLKPGKSGSYYIQDFHLGSRTLDPMKYEKDIMVLEKGVRDRPDYHRYRFYLAQSYMAAQKDEYAIINYKKRIAMGGWAEEIYHSYFQIGVCLNQLKAPLEEIRDAFIACHKFNILRAEPLYELSLLYKNADKFEEGYKWGKMAQSLQCPTSYLFVTETVYTYQNDDNLALCAYYTRRYDEAFILWNKLLTNPALPENYKERITRNLEFTKDAIKKMYSLINGN